VTLSETDAELEQRWGAWLLSRNRRGLRGALWIVITLYPLFGVLDYMIAPEDWLWLLYSTRAFITLVTLVMFRVVRTTFFDRHPYALSASFMILASFGISMMTVFMGGLASPYYAGLTLAIVATGLLFVWPMEVVIPTHATIVISFLLPNVVLSTGGDALTSVSNIVFLVSTALIAGIGQILAYASQREQVANQAIIDRTRANLEVAHEELKKLDKFKSEFFANITHELKTPLTMVLAPLELLVDGELGHISEAQRSTFESMQKSGMKLLRLIADMLDLSRLEESRVRLRIDEHDLVDYLRNLVQEIEVLAERKGIKLTLDTDCESVSVWCDLERMERVFVNLLSNATKFTDSGGQVSVVVKDQGDSVLVQVRDTGVGFPPEMSERIFQRFVQADMGSTRQYGGTGIGLALARELVELHGGRISASSEPNVGSLFEVCLIKDREHFNPEVLDRRVSQMGALDGKRSGDRTVADWRSASDAKFRLLEIDEATEQRIIERDADELRRGHTVLVVEDTPDVIRMVRLALHHEFRVFAAKNGQQGLDLAQRHRPTVIITDLMMPVMDGLELTSRLRKDPHLKHVPVLMLTARNEVESRVTGLQTGVNAYLGKPFSTKELVSTVRSLVRDQERTMDIVMSQKMDSLETIAGGLAHEIGNPLNYLKNSITSIQRDTEQLLADLKRNPATPSMGEELSVVSQRMAKLFQVAENGVRRIGATVDQMVRYSRDGFSRVHQPYDVYAAVREVLSVVLPSARYEVAVVTNFSGHGLVECVPEELHQALTNIIQNAIEASPTDGTAKVEINGWNEGEQLCLSIRDNGTGISQENLTRVFNAFFTTKETGRGMGLGLTIVYRVMRALGGSVDVQSELGVGTQFTLRAPLTQGKNSRRGGPRASVPPPPPPA
jgi:signal transduction histidine kinase